LGVEGRVLIIEPSRLVRRAVANVFIRRGYQVLSVETAAAATRLPHQFDCGIFSDVLPDASAIALAGWFLIEQRIGCAVFFGGSEDVELRLRASNLGTFVGREEGLHRLERATQDALMDQHRLRRAAGGESFRFHHSSDSGPRRRRIV
jgi:hypothetical protein